MRAQPLFGNGLETFARRTLREANNRNKHIAALAQSRNQPLPRPTQFNIKRRMLRPRNSN